MKKVFLILVLCLALAVSSAYGRGGHGGGGHGGGGHGGGSHGGGGHGFHGGHAAGFYRSGGYRGGLYAAYGYYAGYSFYGWYGPGYFGEEYPDLWYYYEPFYDPYAPAPVSARPDPAAVETHNQGAGAWVEVPGQSVSGTWVPPHKVWVPENH